MNSRPLLRAFALTLALSSLPGVTAGGEGVNDSQALRKRISTEISAGLPHTNSLPAPHVLTSKPAALPEKQATTPVAGSSSASSATALAAPFPADTTPEGAWHDLLAGNRRFVGDHPRVHPYSRERIELAAGQHPRVIVLGCADSRVSPELVFDQSLGDIFVVRTAGNIVDPIALGSIEYAVEHLHAQLLVVLGHSSCGAVKAAAAGGEMPSTYLQAIVDRIRPTVLRLSSDELIERSVTANAQQSATDILSNSALIRDAVAKGELKVMSAVYDLHGGLVRSVTPPAEAATATAQVPGH
jgi:carbonic anhydrase